MTKRYNDMHLMTDRLKALLKNRNLSQVELARYLKVSSRYVSKFLHDGMINQDILIEISRFVDCNPFYLTDEACDLLPFASYESWNYDYDDCVKGLLHMQQYAPSDFSKEELAELKNILGRQIDIYSAQHNKQVISAAFWSGTGTESGTVNITFDKKGSDASD